jgi:hypothetical protein
MFSKCFHVYCFKNALGFKERQFGWRQMSRPKNRRRAGDVAQGIQCLICTHEALSSNPSCTKEQEEMRSDGCRETQIVQTEAEVDCSFSMARTRACKHKVFSSSFVLSTLVCQECLETRVYFRQKAFFFCIKVFQIQ